MHVHAKEVGVRDSGLIRENDLNWIGTKLNADS